MDSGGFSGGKGAGGRGGDYHYRSLQQQQRWFPGQDGQTHLNSDQNGRGRGGGMGPTRGGYGGSGRERRDGWTHLNSGRGRRGGGMGPTRGGYGGNGGGEGRGRQWRLDVPVQSQMELQGSIPEQQIVPAMQSQKISGQSLPSPSASSSSPPEVDNSGKNGIWRINLCANHFLLNYNPETIIRHYDIDVKLDMPSKNNQPSKLPKTVLSMIRDKLFSDDPTRFPLSMTAYDGEKNIFSAVPLPTGKFKVELSNEGGAKIRSFTVELQLVNELNCSKLDSYLSGKVFTIPRDLLQAMDVVMKETPARQMIYAGRCFHPTRPDPQDDLGCGITASRGIKYSLKATSQGAALCLDYSVLPFRKPMPVLDFLKEHIRGFNINNFREFRREVENALKGLKVTVTHRISNQMNKIAALTDDNTEAIYFDLDNQSDQIPPRRVSLVQYFKEKYSKDIVYKNIPCLNLGKNNSKIYVPMEFCIIAAGQRFAKERLEKYQSNELRKISLAPPRVRGRKICDMVKATDGPCGGDVSRNFGIGVDMKMTTVTGRVIEPPELKLGAVRGGWMKATVDKRKCDWNLNKNSVISSKPIRLWGVLDFGTFNIERFIPELIFRCKRLNIHMEEPVFYQRLRMNLLYEADNLHQLLERINDDSRKIAGGQLQIILCVMPREDPGYNNLKWISETKVGILTQCCLSANAGKAKDQFLANVALKINAKLGGTNVELLKQPKCLENKSHVMFIGADTNHPGPYNSTSHSIAAVVASMNWPAANQYVARICPQDHRAKKILKFGGMCLELVNTYAQLNQVRPEKIVLYRDGVGESQLDMVLNEECMDLKRTFQALNYFPTITVVVAQKRHTTRLFLDSDRDENVPPGTVVDTKITNPVGFDFYLCSHYGQIGTSKPAHYQVLLDENGFTSDELQELIYGMCFTSAQCTKPVSLVPPVCYADRAAYRGRLYHDSIEQLQSSSATSSSSLPLSTTSMASFNEQPYKLHPKLENSMFFI